MEDKYWSETYGKLESRRCCDVIKIDLGVKWVKNLTGSILLKIKKTSSEL
jgi:hypothetical protein